MPQLGRKYTCYSCHTKFYDLGKPTPICPKCNSDQRDADDAPAVTTTRSRRVAAPVVVEEPIEEPEFPEAEAEAEVVVSDEDEPLVEEREEEVEEEEEDEEY